jgi:hypothetical protein
MTKLLLVGAAAVAITVASAAYSEITTAPPKTTTKSEDGYGDYKEYNVRTVSKKEMKCAGAPGYPYVHYVPCDEGYHCVEKDSYAAGDWGRYCLPITKGYYTDKCHKTGEKCMGAAGFPYVEYAPCCKEGDVCREKTGEKPAYGEESWGSFCLPSEGEEKPVYKEDSKYDSKFFDCKCHTTGSKCQGAPGFPYVEYGNGCCSSTDSCVPDPYMGWGSFCKPLTSVYSDYEKYKEDPKSYSPPSPKYESWFEAPKSYSSDDSTSSPYNPYAPKPYASDPYASKDKPSPYVSKDKIKSLDSVLADVLKLSADFGCGAVGSTPAKTSVAPAPALSHSQIEVFITAPICSGSSVFTDADATALLNAVCAIAKTIDSSATCYLTTAPQPVRMAILDDDDVDVAVRQGGGNLVIVIEVLTALLALVIAALQAILTAIGVTVSAALPAATPVP